MTYFSDRYNLVPEEEIQINTVDTALRNRLFNIIYNREYDIDEFSFNSYELGVVEKLLDSFGCTYEYPTSSLTRNRNLDILKTFISKSEWFYIYDLIEKYFEYCEDEGFKKTFERQVNTVLEEQKSGYRFIKGFVVPITNTNELESLKKSLSTEFDSVNTHFEKALQNYSKRNNPDYENSIKESISAVEAICSIITCATGKQATLGNTLKKLKDNGVHIHSAMENAFSSLYGYTSDENGIRHGGADFKNAPAEDAKYMLISCSAFVNYLIEKWEKVQNQ